MATLALNVATRTAAAFLQAAAAHAIGRLFADDDVEGPRLKDLHVLSSTEGAGLPIVFGRARLAGQVIWATRFTETKTTQSAGGKGGGPKVTDYTYSASFAVAVCEGVIDAVGRVWADGRALDLSNATMRVHRGTEDQTPDPLIEAVEGAGSAPAFRGVAYVVFEDLPLARFGDRIPQLSFEVFRAPQSTPGEDEPRLEKLARAVTLVPASGEFAYATQTVWTELGLGEERAENQSSSRGVPDVIASLDDLQALLPACTSILVVTAWFGDDLRCGVCRIEPRVETPAKTTRPYAWRVNGLERSAANAVSQIDGRPAYGGTPADQSLLELIAELKARGFSVGLYPFLLMDVPEGNGLADPHGAAEQAAYPWRGRITCHPAPGESGTPDKSAAAAAQVAAFFGACEPGDFTAADDTVAYAGPAEWSYRRMILHHARLAEMAGGVDTFLIGSELRGLTTVRDSASHYPAVDALKDLASDVRSILGSGPAVSYAADWSEYFGHQPQDGSNDVHFHLDDLWASPDISFVGVDWYPPLTDWRDGGAHLDADDASSIYDRDYLASRIEGGEAYDWWYASQADRDAQIRTPITDGSGKPWVFRPKDLRNWWSNPHHDRPAGVESGSPTAWSPESKPIWLVEAGFPAIDKSPNQPNVFFDPKSSESDVPHYSNAGRDDLVQRRALEALLGYWDPDNGANPTSTGGVTMIRWDKTHLWTWDARPFPSFPARTDVWSDGENWRLGHWLTGRVGLAPLPDVVADLAGRAGLSEADVSDLTGLVFGYAVDRPMALRAALEPLAFAYRFSPMERSGLLAFGHKRSAPQAVVDTHQLVAAADDGALIRRHGDIEDRPSSARMRFVDEGRDYQAAAVRVDSAAPRNGAALDVAGALTFDPRVAETVARAWLADAEAEAESVEFTVPPSASTLEAGDVVSIACDEEDRAYRIRRVEAGGVRRVTAEAVADGVGGVIAGPEPGLSGDASSGARPFAAVLDLPLVNQSVERNGVVVAAAARPWPGTVSAAAGPDAASLEEVADLSSPAVVGSLLWDLHAGPIGRWDDGNITRVRIVGGALSSQPASAVLNGANLLAVEPVPGAWELFQFRTAVLVDVDEYEIQGLLRGQAGADPEMAAIAPVGSTVVVFDGSPQPAALADHLRGATVAWRFAGPGVSFHSESARSLEQVYSGRDLRPLTPVHVKARRIGGDVHFSWVRRTRMGGDDWAAVEAPLGEVAESYQFEVLDGGAPAWSQLVSTPSAVLSAAEESTLFAGAPLDAFDVRVAQVSQRYGVGARRTVTVYL